MIKDVGLVSLLGYACKLLRHWLKYLNVIIRYSFHGNPYRIFMIDPMLVRSTVSIADSTLKGNGIRHFGRVDGGDWDLNGCLVHEYGGIHAILKARMEDGKEYSDIQQFCSNLEMLNNGTSVDNCKTESAYRKKWEKIECLYRSIKESGYKRQSELGPRHSFDEIRVQLGRHGEVLFEEGMHRLVIAQVLGIKEIPVLVTRRHADWAKLRNAVKAGVFQGGGAHQPFDHFDLDSL